MEEIYITRSYFSVFSNKTSELELLEGLRESIFQVESAALPTLETCWRPPTVAPPLNVKVPAASLCCRAQEAGTAITGVKQASPGRAGGNWSFKKPRELPRPVHTRGKVEVKRMMKMERRRWENDTWKGKFHSLRIFRSARLMLVSNKSVIVDQLWILTT